MSKPLGGAALQRCDKIPKTVGFSPRPNQAILLATTTPFSDTKQKRP